MLTRALSSGSSRCCSSLRRLALPLQRQLHHEQRHLLLLQQQQQQHQQQQQELCCSYSYSSRRSVSSAAFSIPPGVPADLSRAAAAAPSAAAASGKGLGGEEGSAAAAAAAAAAAGPRISARPLYFDYQATTPLDPRVLDAMMPFNVDRYGNPHSSSHAAGWEARRAVEKARESVAALLGLPPSRSKEIIFTSGATESNNLAIKGVVAFQLQQARHREQQQHQQQQQQLQGEQDMLQGMRRMQEESGLKDVPSSSAPAATAAADAEPAVAPAAAAAAGAAAAAAVKKQRKNHIITTQIEHKCVLQCCRLLHLEWQRSGGERGAEVTFLPVSSSGLVSLSDLEAAIKKETVLVSIMMVNNEIGVLQDMKKIGEICKKRKILLHTDAAQAAGKLPINVEEMGIDLLSLSAHKIYGPKGVGALWVRGRQPKVRLSAVIDGGGQERGLRSGTLATPLVVGLGKACAVALECMDSDRRHVERLAQLLLQELQQRLPHLVVNGSLEKRYWGNLNISFSFVEGESLLMSLGDIAMSSGSACTSESLEPSYVLRSLGVGEETAHTSLRIGIGRFTREEEVRYCVDRLVEEATRLRQMSPLYDAAMEEKESGKAPGMVWT